MINNHCCWMKKGGIKTALFCTVTDETKMIDYYNKTETNKIGPNETT